MKANAVLTYRYKREAQGKNIYNMYIYIYINCPHMANLMQQNIAFASALVPFCSCQNCAVVCVDGTVTQESMPQGCSF